MFDDAPINVSGDLLAQENWARYQYGLTRGHDAYVQTAAINEGFYLGAGLQWDNDTRELLGDRMAVEWNEIMPAVNAVLGYQIHNRMDIGFRPRAGDSDQVSARVMSKVVKAIADHNKLPWKETQVMADGCIEQRGYYDVRMCYNDNARGEIDINPIDPRDVIPDPDAKTYETSGWADVTVTRWLTLDEIGFLYGDAAKTEVRNRAHYHDADFGGDSFDGPRSKFGMYGLWGAYDLGYGDTISRYRVIDRQKWEMRLTECAIYPTGDVEVVENLDEETKRRLGQQGCQFDMRMKRRVRWQSSTIWTALHDEISPYPFFTIVPFFPYFRRGQTRGIVDNGISPQKVKNLAVTQFMHALSTTADSGWIVWQNSLTNITTADLENWGAKTGLVLEIREGSTPPQKITHNTVPTGVDRLVQLATQAARDATVPDAMRGIRGSEQESGIAKQSDQFAAQQQLAVVLDNLGRTRHDLAAKLLWLVQHYYDDERVFRITETDPATGREISNPLKVNQFDPMTGNYLNDLTMGEYDVVITEQPMQVTFENSQYEQAITMREKGIAIPDSVVIKHSNLSDKHDVLEQLRGQDAGGSAMAQAEAEFQKAKIDDLKAKTTQTRLESQFSALQTAQIIANTPQTAQLGDTLLSSGGYVDQDEPPLLPQPPAPLPSVDIRDNTHPLRPANPEAGLTAGLHTDRT